MDDEPKNNCLKNIDIFCETDISQKSKNITSTNNTSIVSISSKSTELNNPASLFLDNFLDELIIELNKKLDDIDSSDIVITNINSSRETNSF